VILLCGIPSEAPLRLVRDELARLGVPVVTFNQRRFADASLWWELAGGSPSGELRLDGGRFRLEDFAGVYTRLMEDSRLPELRGEPADSALRRRCRALHEALAQWYEVAHARVVNRARPQGSNGSKPYQSQLIRAAGFAVPETLVTNDPELVREFVARHGSVVYKSISGVRSIVTRLAEDDLARLEHIRWCPVQFQAYVPGPNVRVHVVGAETIATAVRSAATDYRYGLRQVDEPAELAPMEIPDELADRCVRLAAALDLPFAGIDLLFPPGAEPVCLEVNPSPAFSYYELETGQPIARSLARYLAGGWPGRGPNRPCLRL
jgi:glutathione synthase/RimK-type ligase-like ATP-grasp enzyme